MQLQDDWPSFHKEYSKKAAIRWCEEHKVEYTLEPKYNFYSKERSTYFVDMLNQLTEESAPPELSKLVLVDNPRTSPKQISPELFQYASGRGDLPPEIIQYMLSKGFPPPP